MFSTEKNLAQIEKILAIRLVAISKIFLVSQWLQRIKTLGQGYNPAQSITRTLGQSICG